MTAREHPHADPGDGRPQCPTCGKWVWPVIHSCKGVRVAPDASRPVTAQPKPTAALTTDQVRGLFASEAERCGFDGLSEFDRWLAEHDAQVAAQALRQWADDLDQAYPPDVFRPIAPTWLAQVHSFCQQHGRTLDAISAHAMRNAARIARQDADRIAGGAT